MRISNLQFVECDVAMDRMTISFVVCKNLIFLAFFILISVIFPLGALLKKGKKSP